MRVGRAEGSLHPDTFQVQQQIERSLFCRAYFLSNKLEEEVAAGPPGTGGGGGGGGAGVYWLRGMRRGGVWWLTGVREGERGKGDDHAGGGGLYFAEGQRQGPVLHGCRPRPPPHARWSQLDIATERA